MITKRERYLHALRRQPLDDALVWAPNFDYWLANNTIRGTVPEKYRGMSRNDIVRSVDAYIWNRASSIRCTMDPSIREEWTDLENGKKRHSYTTPLGTVYEEYSPGENAAASPARTKHFIDTLDDLRVMKYVVEGRHYEANFAPTEQALIETGDDGIVLNPAFCVPYIQFAKTDAGYINGIYMWYDETEKVEELINVYTKQYADICRIVCKGPADVIACDDNMDELTVPPEMFKRYAIPFYQMLRDIVDGSGKLLEAHWCGRTPHLLPLVKETGLDVVEAVVPRPMAEIELSEILDCLDGKTTLQGGLPAIYMTPHGATEEKFVKYIEDIVLPLKGRPGFILGMSDNVPPDADFHRVEMIADLIR